MVFKCQQDSFLTQYTSVVKSCKSSELPLIIEGKKTKVKGYEVILEDTILFPEGGGQPCDYGWLNDKKVLQVYRRAADAIHFLSDALEEGLKVEQKVDWERRFDHMQQHSGQHLLSAILENDYKLPTTSWWLGEEDSFIELDCTTLSNDVIVEVENKCNKYIRDSLPVTVKICDKNDPQLDMAHTRGLPEDHTGAIRIISIKGVDENMCCGTHVTNLSQLQVVKLIKTEPGKKNKINLKFLVGGRVLSSLKKCLDREQSLTVLLKNEPAKHFELVDKLQKSMKITNKSLRTAFLEIAVFEANKIKSQDPLPLFACINRKDGDAEFLRDLSKQFEGLNIFLFLSIGEGKNGGSILILGEEKHVSALAPRICEILKGKGAGKGSRYQAKVGDLTNISECDKLIENHFKNVQ